MLKYFCKCTSNFIYIICILTQKINNINNYIKNKKNIFIHIKLINENIKY